jgi:plasmid maintenance system antidote protein VapI
MRSITERDQKLPRQANCGGFPGRQLNVPANRITEIINGERAITAATAVALAVHFGTSAEFWMNLQVAADLEAARAAARPRRTPKPAS